MNRLIKFRAWDGKEMLILSRYSWMMSNGKPAENEIIDGYRIKTSEHGFVGTHKKFTCASSLEIMQFTGLLDKNGVEIYEGDLIYDSSGNTLEVIWRQDLASFALRKDGWAYDHYFGEAVDAGLCEVIGNVYETKIESNL